MRKGTELLEIDGYYFKGRSKERKISQWSKRKNFTGFRKQHRTLVSL